MVSSLEKIPPITRPRLIQMGYKRAAQFENLRLSVCSKNKLAFVTIWANWSFQILQLENDDANAWEAFRCEWSQSRHNSSRAPLDDWCIQLHFSCNAPETQMDHSLFAAEVKHQNPEDSSEAWNKSDRFVCTTCVRNTIKPKFFWAL